METNAENHEELRELCPYARILCFNCTAMKSQRGGMVFQIPCLMLDAIAFQSLRDWDYFDLKGEKSCH